MRSLTPSSETRPWFRSRVVVLFTAAITAVICAASAWRALVETDGRATLAAVALFTGAVSLMMLASLVGDAGTWSTTDLDGQPAWRLRLGPARTATVTVVAVLAASALGLVLAALAVGEGSLAGGLVVGALALGVLLLAVELGRVAARAPALVIGVDRLHHEGAGVVVDLGWDDVTTIEWAHVGTRRASLRIGAASDATTHQVRARRSLLPLDHVPREPGIELRTGLLADGPALLRLLRELQVGGRATRESLITRGVPEVSGR